MNSKGFEFDGVKNYSWGEVQELLETLGRDSFKFEELERNDDEVLCYIRVLDKNKTEAYLKDELSLNLEDDIREKSSYLLDKEDLYKMLD